MREEVKLATSALIASTFIIFILVPLLIYILDYEDIIFNRSKLSLDVIVYNFSLLVPLVVAMFFIKKISKVDVVYKLHVNFRSNVSSVVYIYIFSWVALFIIFGGANYRDSDVNAGYESRSYFFSIILILTNSVLILTSSMLSIIYQKNSKFNILTFILLFFVFVAIIFSGSRGLILQLLLSSLIGSYILKIQIWRDLIPSLPQKVETNNKLIVKALKPYIVNIKSLALILLSVVAISFWGVYRDDQVNVIFSTLYRASEPYWHYAYAMQAEQGSDFSILTDAIDRIISIPGRWFGYTYEYSIDGASTILETKLGIIFIEGISLPITYIGEGFLMAGYPGAILFQVFAYTMVLASLWFVIKTPRLPDNIKLGYISYQIVKCLFLYPKSISGVFLVMFYETFRDYIFLLIISYFIKINEKH